MHNLIINSHTWIERFASSVIQVMVGANGPVRGPHPIRASGKSVKDDSSPVRGPHPVRASEQEKEIQGGMVGKKNEASGLAADVRKRVMLSVCSKALPNLSLNVSDTLRATRAKWSGTTCHYLEPSARLPSLWTLLSQGTRKIFDLARFWPDFVWGFWSLWVWVKKRHL